MCSARYDRLCIQGVVNRRAISGNMPSTNQSPSQSPRLTAHIRDITAPLIGWHCCACASLTAKYEPTLHTRACEPSRISALDFAIVLGRIIRGQFSSYGPDGGREQMIAAIPHNVADQIVRSCCSCCSRKLEIGNNQYYDWIYYKIGQAACTNFIAYIMSQSCFVINSTIGTCRPI